MNTRKYTYLLTIAAYGNLSHAASQLNISQAALSKFLIEQEHLLGVELFVSHKKHLYPTPAGKIYLDAARKIIETKDSTLQTINRLNQLPATTLHIACAPNRGADMTSGIYSRFVSLYPTVALTLHEIYSAQQEKAIHEGTIDFAFGVNIHEQFQDVYQLPVTKEELLLAVPSFHALAKYASVDYEHLVSMPLSAFQDTPFVLPGKNNNIRIVADRLFKEAGFTPVVAFESPNGITVDAMIRRGVGVGIISSRYVKKDDRVVYFRIDPPIYETSYIRYQCNREISTMEKCLIGIMIEERTKMSGHILIESNPVNDYLNVLSHQLQTGGFDQYE